MSEKLYLASIVFNSEGQTVFTLAVGQNQETLLDLKGQASWWTGQVSSF